MSIVEVCSTLDVAPGKSGEFHRGWQGDHKSPFRHRTLVFAMDDRCSHGRFKLSMGEVFDRRSNAKSRSGVEEC